MLPNPFSRETPDEVKKREASKKAIEDKVKAVVEIGKKVLASPDCEKYKWELLHQRDEIIKLAIRTVDPDPIKDAFFLRACMNKLGVLYGLLDSIEADAKRKV